MIYFTSDEHFGHDKEFLFKPRGFSSAKEHDETIIKNWNSIINNDDDVYVMGDVFLNDMENGERCLSRLKGHLHFILGNHDTDKKIEIISKYGDILGTSYILKHEKLRFFLCHYPVMTASLDGKHFSEHMFCLCGHTHWKGKFYMENNPYIYNVALDANDNKPVSLEAIVSAMKQRKEELIKEEAKEKRFERSVNEELWMSILQEDFEAITEKTGSFENEVFKTHIYDWNDEIDGNDVDLTPNFYHKASGFKLTWYKYPMRSPETNFYIDSKQFRDILYDCKNSLYKNGGALQKGDLAFSWEIYDKWWDEKKSN